MKNRFPFENPSASFQGTMRYEETGDLFRKDFSR